MARPHYLTEMQKSADRFDLDPFRLLSAARDFAQNGPREHRAKWHAVSGHLSKARPTVRGMMHESDIEATTPR